MKVAAQTLLIIFFLISFTAVLVTATVKFELLNYNFLTNSFKTHNTYSGITKVLKNSINIQVGRGGGEINDIAVLTDLITPENTADFVDKNLFNLLNFVNGNASDLNVYVPINRIPKDILPKNITEIKEEMTLDELGNRFNIAGLENLPLKEISHIGLYDYYILMTSTVILGTLLILILLLVDVGSRLVAPAVTFILSGFVTILFVLSATDVNKYIVQNFSGSMSINKILALTIVPPVLDDLVKIWMYVGIGLILFGVTLFFVKKPGVKIATKPTPKSILLPD